MKKIGCVEKTANILDCSLLPVALVAVYRLLLYYPSHDLPFTGIILLLSLLAVHLLSSIATAGCSTTTIGK